MPQIYDSEDPNLPNLPDTDQIPWSDYDDYLSVPSDNPSSNDESQLGLTKTTSGKSQKAPSVKRERSGSMFNFLNFRHKSNASQNTRKTEKSQKESLPRTEYSEKTEINSPVLQPTDKHRMVAGGSRSGGSGRSGSNSSMRTSHFDDEFGLHEDAVFQDENGNDADYEKEESEDNYSDNGNHDGNKWKSTFHDIKNDHNPSIKNPHIAIDEQHRNEDSSSHSRPSSVFELPLPGAKAEPQSILKKTETNTSGVHQTTTRSTMRSKKKKRRHNRRRYQGSNSKKERASWEPGIDISTTEVFLNSPGSTVTITDYSETRYRVTHYDLYSEMNPKYSKFSSFDSSVLPRNFFNDADSVKSLPEDREYQEFVAYMDKVNQSKEAIEEALNNKPYWSKVRWINVNGLSWEAISTIGRSYNLHPLSIEDLVDIPQRTKMDIYPQHLFVVLPLLKLMKIKHQKYETPKQSLLNKLSHKLDGSDSHRLSRESLSRISTNNSLNSVLSPGQSQKSPPLASGEKPPPHSPLLSSPPPPSSEFSKIVSPNQYIPDPHIPRPPTSTIATREALNDELDDNDNSKSIKSNLPTNRPLTLSEQITHSQSTRKLTDLNIKSSFPKDQWKLDSINFRRPLYSKSLAVGIEQLSMYITSDETVISFMEHSAPEIERAILSRLATDYTILRTSCNASILFQSILDATVDLMYPVVTAYARVLNEREIDILTASMPDLQHTQGLHLMVNELALLKSSILPVSSMINQLREQSILKDTFINENVKIYLSDISDHLLSFIDEIDSMSQTIENLINLIFNTLSVETNNSMQQLSLITVIFLPLSFWTGYYGMNFESFGNLTQNVSFYWKVAVPFSAGLMILIMWKDVLKKVNYIRKFSINTAHKMQFNFKKNNDFENVRRNSKLERQRWKHFQELHQLRRRRPHNE